MSTELLTDIPKLIILLKGENISIKSKDNNIELFDPDKNLNQELINQIKIRKSEIIGFLNNYQHKEEYRSITLAEKKEFYAFSSMQKRLCLLKEKFSIKNSIHIKFKKYSFIINYIITTLIRTILDKLNNKDFQAPINIRAAFENPRKLGFNPSIVYCYMPVPPFILKKALRYFTISEQDRILDIGCGKGFSLKIMLNFPFSRVDGVEISDTLAEIARNNFLKNKNKKPCIYTANAIEFDGYDNYNYFYNPFPSYIMVKVLEKISVSLQIKPRKCYIIYFNPTCHDDILRLNIFFKICEFSPMIRGRIYLYSN